MGGFCMFCGGRLLQAQRVSPAAVSRPWTAVVQECLAGVNALFDRIDTPGELQADRPVQQHLIHVSRVRLALQHLFGNVQLLPFNTIQLLLTTAYCCLLLFTTAQLPIVSPPTAKVQLISRKIRFFAR